MWFLLLIGLLVTEQVKTDTLETIFQWKSMNFAFPYDRSFQDVYKPESVYPSGFEVTWDRIFITMPRSWHGVPASLAFIPRHSALGSSPQLQAYPSWDWHTAATGDFNCSKIISAARVRYDSCNRLWVLDNGINDGIENAKFACPPKLLIFDLRTNALVRSIVLSREVLKKRSILTNFVIDEKRATTCDDVYVYSSDTAPAGPGLIVTEGSTQRSWRLLHSSMLADPDIPEVWIGNDSLPAIGGISGLALSSATETLYFQPVGSDRLFSVPTSSLKSGPRLFGDTLPVTLIGRKSSHGVGLTVNPVEESVVFAPLAETAVASWQPQFNTQRILVESPEKLQYVSDIRWVDDSSLWVITTKFQKFFNRRLNPQDTNIRILRIRPDYAVPYTPVPTRPTYAVPSAPVPNIPFYYYHPYRSL